MYQDQGQQQPPPQQGGNGGQQGPDFFQSVNPQMLNLGVETTSNMLKSQRDKYMPGVSNFWLSLKLYFMVNNSYVQKKLLLLMFPFKTTNWSRISSDDAAVSLAHVRLPLHVFAFLKKQFLIDCSISSKFTLSDFFLISSFYLNSRS